MSDIVVPTGPIWAAAAAERNWLTYRLIPQPDGKKPMKKPVLDGVPTDPKLCAVYTYDEAQVVAEANGLHLGYLPREGSAIVCLDLDGVLKDYTLVPEHAALAEEMLTYETFTEFSPSGTGIHILMARGDLGPILRDRSTEALGLIASEARFFSVSFDLADGAPTDITDAPALRAALQPHLSQWAEEERQDHRDREDGGEGWWSSLTSGERAECAAAMLAALPSEVVRDRERWLEVTFALRLWTECFEAWDRWSATSPENYDPVGNLAVWDGRERKAGNRITIGTLIHMAGEAGVDLGRWKDVGVVARSSARMARLAARMPADVIEQAEAHGARVQEQLEGQEEAREEQADLEALLRRVLVCYVPSISARDARWFDLTQPATLKGTVAEMWTCAGVNNVYGVPGVAQRLLPQAQRTTRMPVIDPRLPYGFVEGDDGLGVINKCSLRSPEGAENPAEVARFLMVVKQVIPDEAERSWFLDWLATKVQRPWERMVGVVNVARTHGTGRGGLFYILRQLFGGSPNATNVSMDNVSGQTSQWSQWQESLLVTVEEADPEEERGVARRSTSSRKAYAVLKDLVDPGVKHVRVNVKGGPTYDTQSFTSYLIATNSEDALPIAEGDRRFTILQGNDERAPDHFYPLCKSLAESEDALDAVWLWLRARDVSGFRCDLALKTDARSIMVEAGKTDLDVDIEMLLGACCRPAVITSKLLQALVAHHSEVGKQMAREGYLAGAVDRWLRDNSRALIDTEGKDRGALKMSVKGYGQMRVRVLSYANYKATERIHHVDLQAILDAVARDVKAQSVDHMSAVRETKVKGV